MKLSTSGQSWMHTDFFSIFQAMCMLLGLCSAVVTLTCFSFYHWDVIYGLKELSLYTFVWELLITSEPLIDHLRWAMSQLWEHSWRQFTWTTRKGGAWLHLSQIPFKRWLPLRKAILLEIALGGVYCEPSTSVSIFLFIIFLMW